VGTDLEVGDIAVEVKGSIALECRKVESTNEGGGDETGDANGLAKVASPGGELSVGGEYVYGLTWRR
jgi:hypothetical protein